MRISAIFANGVLPVRKFEASGLADLVVIAGPNGVGKTRLFKAMLSSFQSPNAAGSVRFVIDATSATERNSWQSSQLDTAKADDVQKLTRTLQQNRKRSRFESSVVNFESDRSIQQIAPYAFSWDYQDPFEEAVSWNLGWTELRSRFQDTIHSIFRKVRSRRELMARRLEQLMKDYNGTGPVEVWPTEFPDPLAPFKSAFRQLLAPKELVDPDPQKQNLEYAYEGNTFSITTLSSGEREVVNIVFDFLLRGPSDCIVFFDEPELHLHPELSYKLLQTLKSVGNNNQFILSTHSPEIITASLDNSVIFVGPPRLQNENQAIRVTEDDNTHRALKLLGQSIGIISLGKRIVLVEGTDSSLDKQTYGAILRDRFPNLVLVPGGGKGVLTSFEALRRDVLERTLWGVEFFMLCDRDVVPLSREADEIRKASGDRLRFLERYHLENYFLDESVLATIFSQMEPDGSELTDQNAIRAILMDIAQAHTSYAVALAASSQVREFVGDVDLMPKDCNGKDVGELVELVASRSAAETARVLGALDRTNIERIVNEHFAALQTSFSKNTDDWKRDIPGRVVLNIFASRAKIPVARLKTLYIRQASTMPQNPFAEIIDLFEQFSTSQSIGD